MGAPLNIQPDPGALDPGVSGFDESGNGRVSRDMTVGRAVRLLIPTTPPTYDPAALMLYSPDGKTLGMVGRDGSGGSLVGVNGGTDWLSARAFGAVGDGVHDDAPAINAALAAANAAGGGTVYLGAGTFHTGSAVTFPAGANNVALRGNGACGGNINASPLGATIIKPASGATFDAITTALPGTPGTAGFVSYGLTVSDLAVDCSAMLGNVTGQGNGIHYYGVRYGRILNVDVFSCPNWAFLCEGDNPTNYSYNITLRDCIAGACAAGARFTNSEQALIQRCIFEGAANSCAASQPYSGTNATTNAYMTYMDTGWIFAESCTYGNLGTYTREAIFVDNGETCMVRGCLFDAVRGPVFHSTSGNHIIAGNAIESPCSATAVAAIQLGAGGHVVTGNVFRASSPNYTYAIVENGAYAGNDIGGNFLVAGSSGTISLNAGSTARVYQNVGYNPVGVVGPPGVPLTTVPYTNNYGVDATVFVNGGTVSAVAIGGSATGQTGGAFRVPSGQTITLTYTGAPTWTWFLD